MPTENERNLPPSDFIDASTQEGWFKAKNKLLDGLDLTSKNEEAIHLPYGALMDKIAEVENAIHNDKRGIGDIDSNARGTAARYNSGKARVDLLPMYMVVDSLNCDGFNDVQWDVFSALREIAYFQKSGEEERLDNALQHLNKYWLECADVFGYGAKKYASWNWVKGMAWSVPIGCIGRHSFAVFRGEMNDPESTLPHVGHILCNVVMLKAYFTGFTEGNDLPPKDFKV